MEADNPTGSSADKPIGPGTRLNDIFEIDEKIATGGMGEVFRGHNIITDEAVAIKIVLGEFARDEKYSNLFFKEAKVLSSLNHPSIVRYQIFTIDRIIGRPYLVMEYIDGISLAERLASGPLGVAEVRRLTAKLADGLETAHAAGVVHRDLSPDNILLSGNDVTQPKLIDFGIARTTQAGHKTFLAGEFAGRTNFASPEQFGLFHGQVDASSDVYSLGLVVVNALQGTPLDMNGTQYEMIEKRKRIPDLSALDADLRPIIEEMLVPNPADRHLTMADVAEYFSGRAPLANLKRSAETPATDPDDYWQSKPADAAATPPAQAPADSNATVVSLSRDEPSTSIEPDKARPAPANATVIAGAPVVPPEIPAPFELPPVEAKPIAWESQPVVVTPPAAALPPARRRSVWPSALTAAVLVLAAGGAGAYYSGALKNVVVLPPQIDALLHGKFTTTQDQVAQDDLPDLAAQPEKPKDHASAEKPAQTKIQENTTATHVTENIPVKHKPEPIQKTSNQSHDNTNAADNLPVDEAWSTKKKNTTRLKPAESAEVKPTQEAVAESHQTQTTSEHDAAVLPVQKPEKHETDKKNDTLADNMTADTSSTEVAKPTIDNFDTTEASKPRVEVKPKVDVTPKVKQKVDQAEIKPLVVPDADQAHSADTGKDDTDHYALPEGVVKYDGETQPSKQDAQATDVAKPLSTTNSQDTAATTGKQDTSAEVNKHDSAAATDSDTRPAHEIVQTPVHDQQAELSTTVHKTETSPEDHGKAKATPENQTDESASETPANNDNDQGGVLPGDNNDNLAQTTLPKNDTGQQTTDDISAKPKNNILPHDADASLNVKKPVSQDASRHDVDQAPAKIDTPVVQEAAKTDEKPGQDEIQSTAKKPVEAKKTEEIAKVEPVDRIPAKVTEVNPASTTSHEEQPTTTTGDQSQKTDSKTQATTALTPSAKTDDNDTSDSESNFGLPSDLLPSENDVKNTPSDTTTNNAAGVVHDESKPSDTTATTSQPADLNADKPIKTETQPSQTTADSENTAKVDDKAQQTEPATSDTDQTVDAAKKPEETATDNGQLPAANDNQNTAKVDINTPTTDIAAAKTNQTADTATKPGDTTTDNGQLPTANDNGDNSARIDSNPQHSDQTADTEQNPTDTATENGQLPATNDSSENTAKIDSKPIEAEQTDKTGQTTDTGTKPSDSTVDSGLPAEANTSVDNGNPGDNAGKKPADQSQSTDVALGEQTTEMKHPEIVVDEGLAKRDNWVANFAAGNCFYAQMTTNVASAAGIMAVAAGPQPFYSLNDSFTSTFGIEPALRGVPIDKRQCAVTGLLNRLRQAPNEDLELTFKPADQVMSGDPLFSSVAGITKPVRTVYLIDNNGKVYDLSHDIRSKAGPGVEFAYRFNEPKSKVKTFKIMLLIGSDAPLAVDFPQTPPSAKDILPAVAKAVNLQPNGVQYAYGFFKIVPKTKPAQ